MKQCPKCKLEKGPTAFYKDPSTSDGLSCWCSMCQREEGREYYKTNRAARLNYAKRRPKLLYRKNHLRTRYGCSLEDYELLLKKQKGVCAICKQKCKTKPSLGVDHCHTTGEIRGLLCATCNPALGLFKDSPKLLLAAIRYLTK